MEILLPVIFSFAIIITIALIEMVTFRYLWVTPSTIRSVLINSSVSILSILCVLTTIELSLRTVLLHSDGGNKTLVSQQWHKQYWHPVNEQGYRDYEHDWNKPVLFIVGDSFIAGHGINNINQRLSSILADKLKEQWSVAILAKNGWNTTNQLEALRQHPHQPDRIIVSYYINDIVNAANQHGLVRKLRRIETEKQNRLAQFLSNHSFLFNWFALNLRQSTIKHAHKNYFQQAYRNSDIWETHTQELSNLIAQADQFNADISFVIWPKLTDLEGSKEFTNKVEGFLRQKNIKTINLSGLFEGRQTSSLIINRWDGHPGIKTNKEVAEMLYTELQPWDD